MTPEEQVTKVIEQFERETINRINQASADGREQIVMFVEKYIAGLQIEMPLSIRQVLNAGGQVRQVQLVGDSRWTGGAVQVEISVGGDLRQERFFGFDLKRGVRVMLLVEQID